MILQINVLKNICFFKCWIPKESALLHVLFVCYCDFFFFSALSENEFFTEELLNEQIESCHVSDRLSLQESRCVKGQEA